MPDREENPRTPLAHRKRSAPTVQWLQTKTPPLTRGRRVRILPAAPHKRNTPAYAGKTGRSPDLGDSLAETPPLTRGRLVEPYEDEPSAEKHPRLRGEDFQIHSREVRRGKHPRLRGEDFRRRSPCGEGRETPPLTRGRQRRRAKFRSTDRNTPAYAGKTRLSCTQIHQLWKHPRLRGEDIYDRQAPVIEMETPPLTRGRPFGLSLLSEQSGNTPAYAGKTVIDAALKAAKAETPPLTRGRPIGFSKSIPLRGNTPAYAGKTSRRH